MTARLVWLKAAESDALLDRLFDFQEQSSFVHDHIRRPRDLLVWDDRSCIHSRTDFDPAQRSLMRRTATLGTTLWPYST